MLLKKGALEGITIPYSWVYRQMYQNGLQMASLSSYQAKEVTIPGVNHHMRCY